MKNSKLYLILYYICFLVTFALECYVIRIYNNLVSFNNEPIIYESEIVSIILLILVSVIFFKTNIKNASILFPIIYIVFVIFVCGLGYIYFKDLIYAFHYLYYFKIILFGYLFLNIYTFLCLTRKSKVFKEK